MFLVAAMPMAQPPAGHRAPASDLTRRDRTLGTSEGSWPHTAMQSVIPLRRL